MYNHRGLIDVMKIRALITISFWAWCRQGCSSKILDMKLFVGSTYLSVEIIRYNSRRLQFLSFFFIKTTKVSFFQPTKIITDKVYHCSIHSGNKFSHSYRNLLRQLCNQTHQVRITWHYKTASRGLVSQSSKHSYIPVIYTSIHDDDYQLRGPLGLSY